MMFRNIVAFQKGSKNVQSLARCFSAMPTVKPESPNFGSGPCKKHPGWSVESLAGAALGRSHRSALGKAKITEAIALSKEVLNLPEGYHLGIVPASDTGAYEMAMWSLLGERPVDVCYWESFGKGWMTDATAQLPLTVEKGGKGVNKLEADYGSLPDLTKTNPDHDICFTWNGTTSGVRVPNGDWIPDDRKGLTICDATSACFAMEMPWEKLDVVTYSWQKVLGGEGAHGILILSPRAVERLESYTPAWPMPKIFRMVKKGAFDESIFKGATINTPSMIAVEDYLDALKWSQSIGGEKGLIKRSLDNLAVIEEFVAENEFCNFLASDPATRSSTSICLSFDGVDGAQVKKLAKLLETHEVAYDVGAYRDAPPGLRIWGGATVQTEDMKKLMPWLKWAYTECQK